MSRIEKWCNIINFLSSPSSKDSCAKVRDHYVFIRHQLLSARGGVTDPAKKHISSVIRLFWANLKLSACRASLWGSAWSYFLDTSNDANRFLLFGIYLIHSLLLSKKKWRGPRILPFNIYWIFKCVSKSVYKSSCIVSCSKRTSNYH